MFSFLTVLQDAMFLLVMINQPMNRKRASLLKRRET